MKSTSITYGLFLLLATWQISYSQISPGKLSASHAHLEGMANCTQCHDLGHKVPDWKCLDCHTEIKNLVSQNRGYHASTEVRTQSCVACHSDHHGRNFDMIRFDTETFDHNLSGYVLEGEHAVIDCGACHKPDNIMSETLSKREGTFLGLTNQCATCHDDFHQGSLPQNCVECHDYTSFRPARGFDHADTPFPLKGRHASIECKACHEETVLNGKPYQNFTDLDFNDCKACHQDPHNGNLPGKCAQCHEENSFLDFTGESSFNHSLTNFELRGKHRSATCMECHANTYNPRTVFQDLKDIRQNACVNCHQDVHDGKFGVDCYSCHRESSFLDLKSMDLFDHNLTDYPLEGQHQSVDCRECHTKRYTVELSFSQCFDCHQDYHQGQFTSSGMQRDCAECHVLDQKFTYTKYGLEEHQVSEFPLEGAHVATPCFACHQKDKEWSFREIGINCKDCHDDIHKGFIDQQFYPDNDCAVCHGNDQWSQVSFDHNQTDWPLEGKHLDTNCGACHFREAKSDGIPLQVFSDLSSDCHTCHNNVHGDQFRDKGITDCSRCHAAQSWSPDKFDHNQTRFPLDGRHASVDCASCHSKTARINGEDIIIYKINRFSCVDCHSY